MKLLLEVIVSIVLHPVAMILMWLNLAGRGNMDGNRKLVWFIVSLIWGFGPILYLLIDDGALW